jgi:hypothetical protein
MTRSSLPVEEDRTGAILLRAVDTASVVVWNGIPDMARCVSVDSALLLWAELAASAHGLEIRRRPAPSLPACLIKTATLSVIWLDTDLDLVEQAHAILHELGHHLLPHTPNSAYALNPARLAPDEVRAFQRQEDEANLFALFSVTLFHYVLLRLNAGLRQSLPSAPEVE